MGQAFDASCGEHPVDLSQFPDGVRTAIELGQAEPGMTRAVVLAALGPPPATATPTLEADDWTYRSSRFSTFVVSFGADGCVMGISP